MTESADMVFVMGGIIPPLLGFRLSNDHAA